MGGLVALGLLFGAVAVVASQLPRWASAAVFVANVAVYVWVWGGWPASFSNGGSQVIHITVLVGGQIAGILGALAPLVWPAIRGTPRWARALGGAVLTYPLWMLVPILFY